MKRTAMLLLPLLLVAAACGDDTTTAGAGAPPPPDDGLVLLVERTGGFVTPEMTFANVPAVSIYADGTVLAPGAMIMIYPGPALVPLHETTVTREQVAELLALADELGLTGEPEDFGEPPIADAPDTVVTVVTGDGAVVHRAMALHEADGADGSLTDEQREARRRLLELVEAAERLGMEGEGGATYEPEAYLARAVAEEPEIDEGSPEPQPRLRDWPVELLTPAEIGDCTVFESDAAEALEELFADADQLTFFTDAEGATWRVTIRPVLPHEEGCEALG